MIAPSDTLCPHNHTAYQGQNLTNRMPLFVFPPERLSAASVMEHMRNHFEDSALDMTGTVSPDVGAMAFNAPYRWRPLTWSDSAGATYLNERAISTQQTGWNFVAQSRNNFPRELAGLMWFGVDDSSTTVHFPVYGSVTRVSSAFGGAGTQDGVVPPMLTFDMTKAFPVFNLVANWAYSRWSLIYPEIKSKILKTESMYLTATSEIDSRAAHLINSGDTAAAVEYVTKFSESTGDTLVAEWSAYFGYLFMRYRDGYVISDDPESKACGCAVNTEPYAVPWYDRIVADTGSRFLVPDEDSAKLRFPVKSKLSLKSFK